MKILLVNDDGYKAKGINALAKIMKQFGEVTVLAPKTHQSGTSMAISLGPKPIAYKDLGIIDGVRWMYLDGTPASCAKFALDVVFADSKPDVVISGINHGSNASTAMWYSGTVGAAREAALDGSVGIAVSLDNLHPDADFSVVEELFPDVFRKLVANLPQGRKVIYNINFPDLPASEIKGVRVATQGYECWVNEFVPYDLAFFKSLNLAAGAPAGTVLAAQIQSGGTGLNIQSASVVILCEPQLKPSIENQAISRAYRMGQARSVLVYRLLCDDTVDERIMQLLDTKQNEFDAFADESKAADDTLELDNAAISDIMQAEQKAQEEAALI